MKKIFWALAVATVLWSCKTASITTAVSTKNEVQVSIDLGEIKNDKVLVTVNAPTILTDKITYHLPKMVPGTYSEDNVGNYIEDLKAFDAKGNSLEIKKLDENSWSIANAKTLDKITYWVNDTYDVETGKGFGSDDIFWPSGLNIDGGKNVMRNS